jgi:uncharacterized membrane protein YedE/YeeE
LRAGLFVGVTTVIVVLLWWWFCSHSRWPHNKISIVRSIISNIYYLLHNLITLTAVLNNLTLWCSVESVKPLQKV